MTSVWRLLWEWMLPTGGAGCAVKEELSEDYRPPHMFMLGVNEVLLGEGRDIILIGK